MEDNNKNNEEDLNKEENSNEKEQSSKNEVVALNPKPPAIQNEAELLTDIKTSSRLLWERILAFFDRITDIRTGMDEEGTCESIKSNVTMKGSNVWLLMSAIMVASLGLNLNSPAVIIGAMLISPLMSPILGVGLAVSVIDRQLLYSSLYNFAIAIVVSLVTSTLYFFFTPLDNGLTSEIAARTSPSILDVLVAFFGGIAGIVSGTRLEKSNAIPGVAIATALLPPLCVSGYGLANGEWTIMFNSFYLFFLNCVFIATATYIVVRIFLQFDLHDEIKPEQYKRTKYIMIGFVILVSIPSVLFLRNQMEELQYKRNIKEFVAAKFEDDKHQVEWEISPIVLKKGDQEVKTDTSLLKIYIVGEPIDEAIIKVYAEDMVYFDIKKTKLKVIQWKTGDDRTDISELQSVQLAEIRRDMMERFQAFEVRNEVETEKNKEIEVLNHVIDSLNQMQSPLQSIDKEIKSLFPDLLQVGYAPLVQSDLDSVMTQIPTVIVKWKKTTNRTQIAKDEKKLSDWMRVRLGLKEIQVLRY